jgi:hypothetical protein
LKLILFKGQRGLRQEKSGCSHHEDAQNKLLTFLIYYVGVDKVDRIDGLATLHGQQKLSYH